MAGKEIKAIQIQRNDTVAGWAEKKTILRTGEFGVETDTGKFKIGNGVEPWNSLPYAPSGEASNADTLDGKHASAFAIVNHTHTKSHISDFPTSLKNPTAFTVQFNGTTNQTYDGSTAKTVNITPAAIGAAAASHGHESLQGITVAPNWNTLRSNLGEPSLLEIAAIESEMDNKLWFYPPANISFEESSDGNSFSAMSVNNDQKQKLVSMCEDAGIQFTKGKYYRITITNSVLYVYLDMLYLYLSTAGNSAQIKIEKRLSSSGAWSIVTDYTNGASGWPGHMVVRHSNIPFTTSSTDTARFNAVRITIKCAPKTNDYANMTLYRLAWYGGYPANKRTIYSWDKDKNVIFPAKISVNGNAENEVYHTGNKPTAADVGAAASNHSHSVATTSAAGFFSSADKSKLDKIAAGANNYTHPTTAGNKHIPAGGASGQILRWSADGTAVWGTDNNTTYGVATQSANGLMAAADKKKLDGIASGANNYSHPASHPASIITPDATHRFVTDTEKSTWNGKANASHTHPYLPLTGGTMSGNVKYTMFNSTQTPFEVYGGDADGQGIAIGAGGATIVGSGESKVRVKTNLAAAGEKLYLSSDYEIVLGTNLQSSWEARKEVRIDTSGQIYAVDGTKKVYHTGNKPTPAEIGAAPTSHSHTKSQISDFPASLPANGGTASYANYVNANNIAANTDLNTLTTPGFYYCPSNATVATFKNSATTNAFFMVVGKHAGTIQTIHEYMTGGQKIFTRNLYSGTWGAWQRFYTSTNKPTAAEVGAAAASHTHTKAQISDFIDTVNNISATGGTVTLATNSVYKGSFSSAVTFSYPTPVANKMNQIMLYMKVTSAISITWGSVLFVGSSIPTIEVGKSYRVIFEYDPIAAKWCVGTIESGAAA